ncbi:Acetyltransferase (GNAT) family protein [Nocardioides terrae]|uniref:Acetyltransferase (GNAT) family protein n=1 Tax=Nocardioides terrae TaxID=574651 RepID=A0A1I1MNS9_9ACTN|nr:GNAT family N-acetyltransferase [Nocardioides terrae]SFC87134.1 Acetyltransferase (GNAT) family protein [Nocardioides terrae]
MTLTEIVQVRPGDALFDQWYATYAAADGFGRGDNAVTYLRHDMDVFLTEPSREWRQEAYAGLVDGRVVVAGWLALPLLDNRWRGDVEIYVLPEERRRGFGSAMLAHLEGLIRAEGRTSVLAEVAWPYADGPTGSGPGPEFARAHGFGLALGDVQRQLPLPVADELLRRLAADAAEHSAGYTLRSWVGPVPEELVGEWAELNASLDTEAPMGDLDIEPQVADVAVVREDERLTKRQRRATLHTVALRSDGRLAAYTLLMVPLLQPDIVYQWGTLVRREDRGHRLGVAVKVANLQQLQATRPQARRLLTYNAESNAHMVAVNDELGFVPTERLGEFQKKLA